MWYTVVRFFEVNPCKTNIFVLSYFCNTFIQHKLIFASTGESSASFVSKLEDWSIGLICGANVLIYFVRKYQRQKFICGWEISYGTAVFCAGLIIIFWDKSYDTLYHPFRHHIGVFANVVKCIYHR